VLGATPSDIEKKKRSVGKISQVELEEKKTGLMRSIRNEKEGSRTERHSHSTVDSEEHLDGKKGRNAYPNF